MARFCIFTSCGNDGIALMQWAVENDLRDVEVVYTNTGWAADGWVERVERVRQWVNNKGNLGWRFHETHSIGFMELARQKKGFPTQQYQWCSYILKIEPGMRWLEENDPDKHLVCLIGVRREESEERKNFPAYLAKSGNHGDRMMLAPLVDFTEEMRNEYIRRTGFEVLPHRSRECKCINSNRADMKLFTEADIQAIETAEAEIGKTMYRPHRHMGAKGIREVIRWAHSPKGKYDPEPQPELNLGGCDAGTCRD